MIRHSYQWFPANWQSSRARARLDLVGRAIYRELLDHMAMDPAGCLPDEPALLASMAGASKKEFDSRWPNIQRSLVKDCDGNWRSRFLSEKIREQEAFRQRKAESARASAHSRWDANAMRTHSERNANALTDGASVACGSHPLRNASLSPSQSQSPAASAAAPRARPPAVPADASDGDGEAAATAFETAALGAMREKFPAADVGLARRVVAAAIGAYAAITPDELAEVVRLAGRKHATSPGLYLTTVPEEISKHLELLNVCNKYT